MPVIGKLKGLSPDARRLVDEIRAARPDVIIEREGYSVWLRDPQGILPVHSFHPSLSQRRRAYQNTRAAVRRAGYLTPLPVEGRGAETPALDANGARGGEFRPEPEPTIDPGVFRWQKPTEEETKMTLRERTQSAIHYYSGGAERGGGVRALANLIIKVSNDLHPDRLEWSTPEAANVWLSAFRTGRQDSLSPRRREALEEALRRFEALKMDPPSRQEIEAIYRRFDQAAAPEAEGEPSPAPEPEDQEKSAPVSEDDWRGDRLHHLDEMVSLLEETDPPGEGDVLYALSDDVTISIPGDLGSLALEVAMHLGRTDLADDAVLEIAGRVLLLEQRAADLKLGIKEPAA